MRDTTDDMVVRPTPTAATATVADRVTANPFTATAQRHAPPPTLARPAQEIGHGAARLAPMLAGFNFGGELAQLSIVAVALPVLWLLSRTPRYHRQLLPAHCRW